MELLLKDVVSFPYNCPIKELVRIIVYFDEIGNIHINNYGRV